MSQAHVASSIADILSAEQEAQSILTQANQEAQELLKTSQQAAEEQALTAKREAEIEIEADLISYRDKKAQEHLQTLQSQEKKAQDQAKAYSDGVPDAAEAVFQHFLKKTT